MGALLQPGAFAKRPLGPLRLPSLTADLPLAFVYGATDWMDIGAAHAVASAVDAQMQATSANGPRFVSVEQVGAVPTPRALVTSSSIERGREGRREGGRQEVGRKQASGDR